ncbi:hypothetical protein PVAND_009355 [Polypedilum vanderplanki]|uniref:Ionotropic receptor n=1 Tax=Polypedilum vanderplanki TaxID=319348 RepID=A0A9J6CCC7_POLVA|nr:hypothetical protein PVAND_009355 [Polypedilum vanderplanki]
MILTKIILYLLIFYHPCLLRKISNYSALESSTLDHSGHELVAKAIADVIQEFFISNQINFDLILYKDSSSHLDNVINKVRKILSFPTACFYILNDTNWNHELKQSAIIFIKSRKNLFDFYLEAPDFMPENNAPSEKRRYLIYIEEVKTFEQLENIIRITRDEIDFTNPPDYRYFEVFIVNEKKFVNFYARVLFSDKICGIFTPKILNSFDKKSQNWTKNLENFDHYKNFQGCLLNFYIDQIYWYNIRNDQIYQTFSNSNFILNEKLHIKDANWPSLVFEVVNELAKMGNFTPNHVLVYVEDGDFSRGHFTRNFKFDLHHGFFINPTLTRALRDAMVTYPLAISECYFLVSYNDFYTNYEKLVFPFDTATWILILLTFGFTFATICILKFCPKWIRTIVFGRGILNPAYNALGIFFGISQLRLPNENFCRSLLIIYIWFCLIIRTCFQSKMFEFMTSDMRKPLPTSIDDLLHMNYSIIFPASLEPIILYHLYEKKNIPVAYFIHDDDLKLFYNQALKGTADSKYAFFVTHEMHSMLNDIFKDSLPVMENDQFQEMIEFIFDRNCILLENFDDLMAKLIPSGILQFLNKLKKWFYYTPLIDDNEDTRKILSLKDLEYGFVLFLTAGSISIFVFICELHALYVRRQMRKLLGLYEFIRIVRERLKDYHDKWKDLVQSLLPKQQISIKHKFPTTRSYYKKNQKHIQQLNLRKKILKFKLKKFKMKTRYLEKNKKVLGLEITFTCLLIFLALCVEISCQNVKYKALKDAFIENSAKSVSKSIADVINEFYMKNHIDFDFIIFGNRTNHINDVINGIKNQSNHETFPTVLKHIRNFEKWDKKLNRSAIVFISSLDNHSYLDKFLVYSTQKSQFTNLLPKKFKFLVYIQKAKSFKTVEANNKFFLDRQLKLTSKFSDFEFLILNSRNKVILTANVFYSEKKCGESQLKILNTFDKKSQKWDKKLKNFDHFANFHGCIINFETAISYNFYVRNFPTISIPNEILFDRNTKYSGAIGALVNALALRHNFTIFYKLTDYKGHTEYERTLNYNLSSFHTFQIYKDIKQTFSYNSTSYSSQPLLFLDYYFLISHNEFYTNYEKLTFPFDTITWILIFFTFGLTFASILGLNFCPQWVRTIVFGEGINNAAYNALGIFFGISQMRLAQEFFCRTIFIIYLWFCLIIRTCWQSMMFECITNDMRKPMPESIEDLLSMDYNVVVFENITYKEMLNGRDGPEIESDDDDYLNYLYEFILNGELNSKYAFLVRTDYHALLNLIYKKSLPIMKNERLTKPCAFTMMRHNIMTQPIDEMINDLIPSGIFQYEDDYGMWYHYRPVEDEIQDSRRILSMYDLEFGFVIIFGFLGLSIIVFICELHALYVRRQMRKLLGLYEFIRVVRERLKDYHDKW